MQVQKTRRKILKYVDEGVFFSTLEIWIQKQFIWTIVLQKISIFSIYGRKWSSGHGPDVFGVKSSLAVQMGSTRQTGGNGKTKTNEPGTWQAGLSAKQVTSLVDAEWPSNFISFLNISTAQD